MREQTTLLLNGAIETYAGDPTMTLLEWLRGTRRLMGTKEGCAEGDCGACTVVLAERGETGAVRYRAVNACILFMPMLEGKGVITVDRLRGPDGALHPVQQAMVDQHGSQCGFCTPGFVMSLYAAYLSERRPDLQRANDLLAGNLCRCTGYGPIIAAARAMGDAPPPAWDVERRQREAALLGEIAHAETVALRHGARRFLSPVRLDDLARLAVENSDAVIVGGATDVGLWVTKQHRVLETLIHIGRVAELQRIEERDGGLLIGAGVSYTDATARLAATYPDLGELIRRLGGIQVRNVGTIGGNIANGSPIGDMPPAMIALGVRLHLRHGRVVRTLALEDFFLAYGKQDRRPGEIVTAIEVPTRKSGAVFHCYKLSKRFDQDISAVCGAFNLTVVAGGIASARIAYGGMAPVPKRAKAVEAALIGKPWTLATLDRARAAFAVDFAPISDMRASARYRLRAAENMLVRAFHETAAPGVATRLVGAEAAFA